MTGLSEERKLLEEKINNLIDGNKQLKGFYEYMLVNDNSLTTIFDTLAKVKVFLTNLDKNVNELTAMDYAKHMLDKRVTEDGELSTATYKRGIYYALKNFTKYLMFIGELSYNPMEQISIPANKDSQKTIEKREKGFLTNEEISLVLRNVEKSTPKREKWRNRDRAIIEVFLVTGIRCSALYKLDVSSVDLENCTLIVTDKGGKVKVCDMPEVLVNHMKEWLQDRENILGDKAEEALFISNRLKRVSKRNIEDIVHRYSDVLGRNISPHKLRATYGTRIYEETKDIVMVQECMGHANIETSRIYVRGKKNSIKQASEIMAQSIN